MKSLNSQKEFKKNIFNRNFLTGAWFQLSDPNTVELISKNNFDWVCFDFEHGIYNYNNLPDLLRSSKINKKISLVRTLTKESWEISKILDLGADGIIVPRIETTTDVKKIYDATYFPPKGSRGVGYSRANSYGLEFQHYNKVINNNLVIIGMIETCRGVDNLEDILKLKLLDGLFIGPYDLSASIGSTGNFKSKKFIEYSNRIQQLIKKYKISCGIHLLDNKSFSKKKLVNKNYNFNAYLTDGIFFSNYKV